MSDTDKMLDAVNDALTVIARNGGMDGSHHKQWVLDQVVRVLCLCPRVRKTAKSVGGEPYEYLSYGENEAYSNWLKKYRLGGDGPYTYAWDEGIPP